PIKATCGRLFGDSAGLAARTRGTGRPAMLKPAVAVAAVKMKRRRLRRTWREIMPHGTANGGRRQEIARLFAPCRTPVGETANTESALRCAGNEEVGALHPADA